ncbi:MAG: hypothetical protein AAF363_19180 [Bacteroidota bacterium]
MNIKLILFFALPLLLAFLSGCGDDDPVATSVGFSESSLTISESSINNQISVNFDANTADSIDISFELGGFAALNGDYRLNQVSPITIAPGVNSFDFEIEIIDEQLIESFNDTLTITITNAENLQIPVGANSFDLIITDNDVAPTNGVQFDLEWFLGEGVDIDLTDLNLALATGVVIENNSIVDFNAVQSPIGNNSMGFESFILSNDAPDDEYFIVVIYTSGDQSVNFLFNLNGAGFNDAFGLGNFSANEEGNATFFGPITKSGNSFSARRSSNELKFVGKVESDRFR